MTVQTGYPLILSHSVEEPQPLARLAIASAMVGCRANLLAEPPVTLDQVVPKMAIASLGLCAMTLDQARASFPLGTAVTPIHVAA